jgi:hypothetical protein
LARAATIVVLVTTLAAFEASVGSGPTPEAEVRPRPAVYSRTLVQENPELGWRIKTLGQDMTSMVEGRPRMTVGQHERRSCGYAR